MHLANDCARVLGLGSDHGTREDSEGEEEEVSLDAGSHRALL